MEEENLGQQEQTEVISEDNANTDEETLQDEINKWEEIAEFSKRMLKKISKAIVDLITLFINPYTWLIIISVVLIIGIFSFSQVVGPPSFSVECSDNGVPKIETVEDDYKVNAIYSYLVNNSKISKEVAGYIALYSKDNYYNYKKSYYKFPIRNTLITIPEFENQYDCDTYCLFELVNRNAFPDGVTLGLYNFSGEDSYNLIQRAVIEKTSWEDSSVQLAILKITLENKGINTVEQAAQFLKQELTGADIDYYKEKSKQLSETLKTGDITGCVSMGTGRGIGRVDGGGAIDTGAFGALDMSSLIDFLESYNSSKIIYTKGQTGEMQATQEMIAAKLLAEEKGGKDPIGNLYSSCDRNVATALKAMEIDVNFPWGAVRHQIQYMESQPTKWAKVSNEQRASGDVVTWGTGHIAIYGINSSGQEMFYQASHYDYLPFKSKAPPTSYQGDNFGPNGSFRQIQYWRYLGNE